MRTGEAPRQARGGFLVGRVGDWIRARTACAHCADYPIRIHVLRRSPAGVVKRAGRICAGYRLYLSLRSVYSFFQESILTVFASFQGMEPANLRDYILHSERWVYLDVYMGTLDGGPLLGNVPKGQMVGYLPRHLHLNAQKTMYLSIQLLLKVIGIGCCPRNLIVKNIVLTSPDCRPRFTANVDFDQNPDNRTCDAAMSALAGIFETILCKHLPGHESVPDEVHNLLYLMRQPDCFKLTEAIQYHPCLVPLENRGHLFLKEYQYTVDILRKIEPLNFRYVMTQLVYPRHWKIIAESNPYVQAVIERGDYDSERSKESTYTPLEPLKLQRHAPCHCLQDAANKMMPHGLGFEPADMNHSLYIMSEHLLASLQLALHRVGHLACLKTSFLFPWN
ncbi:hypothetical protein SEVIR_9G577200v4 [Setaria viridis]|uniref:Uncharacterized protein n=1 Tax=Setaria viridis TaxID=4556 RepID=A0A4U6T9T2_SETVI|nr:uncharacterized protein LOC117838163 [Setaria viridis]TKV98710.1 hypothetical protein SEVIR_9G577200v2 [Setaria viridis]